MANIPKTPHKQKDLWPSSLRNHHLHRSNLRHADQRRNQDKHCQSFLQMF